MPISMLFSVIWPSKLSCTKWKVSCVRTDLTTLFMTRISCPYCCKGTKKVITTKFQPQRNPATCTTRQKIWEVRGNLLTNKPTETRGKTRRRGTTVDLPIHTMCGCYLHVICWPWKWQGSMEVFNRNADYYTGFFQKCCYSLHGILRHIYRHNRTLWLYGEGEGTWGYVLYT